MESSCRIKIRQRAPFPKPWKWEIYVGDHLVTASHDSFASQEQAYASGQEALERFVAEPQREAISHKIHEGRMVPKVSE
jgi:hypothetical protein